MQTLSDYLNEKSKEEIINEIIELKMKKPQTQEMKMRIQKLQQKLSK
jgi:hypothetical protein|tara:strand:+ start:268 stop:408 length:141 start_codon:yes stop_codon:yes gene_type:complete